MNINRLLDMRAAVAAVLFLLSYGCSTEEFASFTGQGDSAQLTDGKNSKDDLDATSGSDGKSEASSARQADTGNKVTREVDADAGDAPSKGGVDADSGNGCRFFADQDHAELIEGGPGIPISPQKMDGYWEGDDYVFEFEAWQGPMGAEAQVFPGAPVMKIGYSFDEAFKDMSEEAKQFLVQETEISFIKDKNHWQLEPIPTLIGTFGVKHTYQGVITNANKASCEVQLKETTTPLLERSHGCFALTTKIRMADGSDRFVALLNVGDMILNPVTNKPARITEIVSGPEKEALLAIGYGNDSVRVTQKHPMVTAGGIKEARQLTGSDKVLGADGRFHLVQKIEALPIDPKQVVRNLVINPESKDPRDHMVLADGIVTGDLYLQRQLEKPNDPSRVAINAR